MESLLAFFESIPPVYRTAILAAGLVGFWLLEGAVPLFALQYAKLKHAGLNLFFTLTTLIVNFAFAVMIVLACEFTTQSEFGLLYLLPLPLWLHVLLGVLLLDLIGAYLIHFIEHKIRWLWKFHLIHHTDEQVDVTTALRHHPGESLFRAVFTILGILVAGIPIGVIFLYQTLSALFAQMTHANISTPPRLDRWLSYVFVTPRMHKVHHHFVQPLTDTNYGNIFSIWDRMFGTFAEVKDTRDLRYGIDTHLLPEENSNLRNLLTMPFQPYRPPTGSKFSEKSERSTQGAQYKSE